MDACSVRANGKALRAPPPSGGNKVAGERLGRKIPAPLGLGPTGHGLTVALDLHAPRLAPEQGGL